MEFLRTAFLIGAACSASYAGTFTTIHSFAGSPNDGWQPLSGVVMNGNGVLYGTTAQGTAVNGGLGTVFSLTPPTTPGGAWVESLYPFPEVPDDVLGAGPLGVAVGGGGLIYGTATAGGPCEDGTVFLLQPPVSTGGSWREQQLMNSCPPPGGPTGPPLIGPGGVLYFSAFTFVPNGCSIMSLSPPASQGASWTSEVLYTVVGTPSQLAWCNLLAIDPISNILYLASVGNTLYSLSPPAIPGGAWQASELLKGVNVMGLVISAEGVLYGTTSAGGAYEASCIYSIGCGTVFALGPTAAGPRSYETLYDFTGNGTGDGANPWSGPLIGANGVLYGTTNYGGTGPCPAGCGTIFSLTPPASLGGSWTESVLYSFTNVSDGAYPEGKLAIDSHGVLYGVTTSGGITNSGGCRQGCGTVWSFAP